MKTIFTISPDYLEAVFQESKKFSFNLQGYGSLDAAMSGLVRTNVTDLLGFVYLGKELPFIGSESYLKLLKFIERCELLETSLKFVFVCEGRGQGYLDSLKDKFRFIRIYLCNNCEFISDAVINKNCFGSILLDQYEPYIFEKKDEIKIQKFSSPVLKCIPVLHEHILKCLSQVARLDSCDLAVERDAVLQEYIASKNILSGYRELLIRIKYGEDTIRLKKLIADQLESSESDIKCWLLALYSIIVEEDKVKYVDFR